jgi:hypothetical protein
VGPKAKNNCACEGQQQLNAMLKKDSKEYVNVKKSGRNDDRVDT